MPTNEAGDWQLRRLDCLVINELVNALATPGAEGSPPLHVQTVRGAFEEGNEAFPGSMIKMQTHIQIAVRDHACILGVFLPHLRKE